MKGCIVKKKKACPANLFALLFLSFFCLNGNAENSQRNTQEIELVRPSGIIFLQEKEGEFEQTVKNALVPLLETLVEVRSAYLVLVEYGINNRSVALCLDAGVIDERLIAEKVSKVFKNVAGKELFLDILFLNEMQRLEVEKVARAFYRK
ncbi:MAG: enhanced serine sensitivity protein SseB C-terminal domain-containing protein [Gammaproteobacteria bacterium]|nr:enhanced serine sensitivity protein SseB C-terminal domain-containing protein [Gammaproteobacteria bacterium]